jgi:D-tyrosyl-tRNA(Tyr) deacylase
MKIILQRVSEASVKVSGETVGSISLGWLALIGISPGDTKPKVEKLCDKLLNLRCFADSSNKMNNSLLDIKGEILAISQFTLYADCKKGRRPSFIKSASPEQANELYEYAISTLSKSVKVEKGIFGADMKVSLVNDGPVTIILDSDEIC